MPSLMQLNRLLAPSAGNSVFQKRQQRTAPTTVKCHGRKMLLLFRHSRRPWRSDGISEPPWGSLLPASSSVMDQTSSECLQPQMALAHGVSRAAAVLPLVWGLNMTRSLLGLVLATSLWIQKSGHKKAPLPGLLQKVGGYQASSPQRSYSSEWVMVTGTIWPGVRSVSPFR